MAAQKRIAKELGDLAKSPPAGMTVNLADESNIFEWRVTIEGPAGSPYAGYLFAMNLTLPSNYPFKPPTVTFATKIYHPNISNDSPPNSGIMCLGMLRETEWKPSTKIFAVLEFARQLLKEPNPDDAVEAKIADQYRTDKAGFEKEARDWCKRYAKPMK
ncbi:ubiquitin-conjugating enzyme E2 D/E [Cladophialophora yegresii CBS 114405]|uniref:E2 ubiquitin-conjugating enzyme n=1 Tax=Cladophialophora yegresii CBS 114405 TaxID=1182544 RepID=W9VX86_9EURO|nr:ubiquitin-conjugating enzyme E2 D/E [Cladophialophora yegresii CBS 114405]EXJ57320.1 ubiquitin-conjugating enzyme E2 D/E [Cladophialophora yegresii CBS 114405]